MPPCYDIYVLSSQRNAATIERFLNRFSHRERIENREGQQIAVYKNEKYGIRESLIPIETLTEVIEFGIAHPHLGFSFYISDHLKGEISYIILKFTFDEKIIFGISIEKNRITDRGTAADNFDSATALAQEMKELTGASHSLILTEYAPPDDEDEFVKLLHSV